MKLGATGSFPRGKSSSEDEGGLTMAVVIRNQCVEIHFGKPTAWIGMERDFALKFAEAIKERALQLPHSA